MARDPLAVAAAAAVGVVGAARITRLVTKDHWPPMAFVRRKYVELTGDSEWSVLAECPFCVAPYVVAADLAWAVNSDLDKKWWLFNGWMAASYAAAWIVVRDDVPEQTIKIKSDEADETAPDETAPPPAEATDDGAAKGVAEQLTGR